MRAHGNVNEVEPKVPEGVVVVSRLLIEDVRRVAVGSCAECVVER